MAPAFFLEPTIHDASRRESEKSAFVSNVLDLESLSVAMLFCLNWISSRDNRLGVLRIPQQVVKLGVGCDGFALSFALCIRISSVLTCDATIYNDFEISIRFSASVPALLKQFLSK